MTRDDLLGLLTHDNLVAFLRVIRTGETDQTDNAYRMIYGGELIDSLEKHPRIPKKTPWGWTSAAGAYQFMAAIPGKVKTDTWDGLERKYGPLDFSPATQDLMAVALIRRRGAIDDVLAGRFDEAIRKCSKEWASLPGSPYGQPTISLERARAVYHEHGGALAAPSAAVPVNPPEKVKPMAAPVLMALLPSLIELIPSIAGLFKGSGSEVAQRNVAAATMVAEAAVKAVGAANAQEAIEMMREDPAKLEDARAAVGTVVNQLMEAGGGGIDGARKAAAADGGDWRKVFISVPMVVIFMLMPIIYFVIYHVVTGETWSAEIKASVVSAVVSGVLFAVVGFALGTSYGSQKKDAMLGSRP